MKTTHLRTVLVGVLVTCGTLATVVGVAHSEHDQAQAAPAAKGPYVALGDSYTAGPKIPGQTGAPAGCDRSDRNYPSQVASRLGVADTDFRDVSCSGAPIADLTQPQTTDQGTNAPQLSALSPKTRLVTLGIGGNDIGFGSMIKRCGTMGLAYQALGSGKYIPEDTLCRGHYVHRRTDELERMIDAAGERLAGALTEINRRAPQARVYVVGYPAILPADGADCGGELPLAPGDMSYLREKEQQLNSELRERARASGAVYVDTYRPSEGRDACSDAATRWIEPLVPSSPAAAVHPNERGERGMADAVLDALR
ncbi:SGNH/GDSL hydrolase family protein [Streptomyces sp. P3]|uniref:SGNH/GDSL hydrolase family protein n=1 Tax=Streptomyces sp. P3 TaxID=2135430 RepID=UPI00131EF159|nr:SGNH/GDSL hydrolase family protein [Streptomyces sp. P3]